MDTQTLLNRIEELFRTIHLGLWVLWTESRWLAGPDIGYQRRLSLMRGRRQALQTELARMATLADPRREQFSDDLALLEGDIARLEKDREERRAAHLAPLRTKFGWLLYKYLGVWGGEPFFRRVPLPKPHLFPSHRLSQGGGGVFFPRQTRYKTSWANQSCPAC